MVEMLTEEFYINITHVANGDGKSVDGISIGKDRRTILQIKDDDGKNIVALVITLNKYGLIRI